jgi:hypothetical protein
MAEEIGDASFNSVTLKEPFPVSVPPGGWDNLIRLRLLREIPERLESKFELSDIPPQVASYAFTALGWEFVKACREPQQETRTHYK